VAPRPLGFVSWRRHQAAVAAFSWEIGIALLPEARGAGHGTQAQRLLARYLFAHTTAHRIMASTEVTNQAERRALETAGFTEEGIARGVGWRDGQWRDGVTYSLLRTDRRPDRPRAPNRGAPGQSGRRGAKHGYALAKDIESFAGVRLAPGTLYEALARLQAQGLIEPVESHDRRRPYQLTAVGAATLRAQLDAQRRVADVGLRRLAQRWGTA
jgi:Transcriptional regulator PadR-like family/Acetyltransferase (GNAT) domain